MKLHSRQREAADAPASLATSVILLDTRSMHPGACIAERYVVEARVGVGGMGAVYKARDGHGRPVALKVMLHGSTEWSQRFSREAELLMTLEHPAIVRCLDQGITADGRHFMVMEWLDGIGLDQYLAEHRLSVRTSLALVGRIAEALAIVHAHDVVHRDVKPANVYLPNSDIEAAKLLDFGVAHWSSVSRITPTGMQVGTPSYMAPEQIRGDDVDARADVFSLGCVLYLCLSGEPAYSGHHLHEVYYKILIEEPPQLSRVVSGVPRPVRELLQCMMSKERGARPGDAAEVVERIVGIQADVALSDGPAEPTRDAIHPGVITRQEQRIVSIVAVAVGASRENSSADGESGWYIRSDARSDTRSRGAATNVLDTLLRRYEALGIRFEYRADGTLLGVFDSRTAATDQVADAARCALDIHRTDPAKPIVVTTGRANVSERPLTGEALDRVDEMLGFADISGPGGIRVGPVTAGLIEQRFQLDRDERGHKLICERNSPGGARLLGNPTPFVGRARELASLRAAWTECIDESMARVVLISGPMGIGKSRLAQQFLRSIRDIIRDSDGNLDMTPGEERGIRVEIAEAGGNAMGVSSPLELLAHLIRGIAGIQEGEAIDTRRDKLAGRVRAALPPERADWVAMFLGELIRAPWPESSVQLRAARCDPRLMGQQIRRASHEFLSAETQRHPVLLLLENLHWSDAATVSWVGSTLRQLQHCPLLIVAVGRRELHERFPRIWSKHDLLELRLCGLSPRNAERLARSVLGASIPELRLDQVIPGLVRRADGNPLYLEELIRSTAAGRTELPDTVLAMMHVRLQELPDMSRRALRAASVIGDCFWTDCVAALCGPDVDAEHELRWLTDEEFLLESPASKFAGQTEYRFRHDLIREAAYGMLTDDDRQLAHQRTGQWLHQVGETDALVIAEHLERSGTPEEARPYLLQAAVSAGRTGDLEAGEAIAARGVSLGCSDATHGALRAVQVKAYQWRGQLQQTLDAAEEALALLPLGSRAWYQTAEDLVAAQSGLDQFTDLEQRAGAMTRGCPDGHDRSGWLIVAARLAWMLFVHGKAQSARPLLVRVDIECGRLDELEPTVAASVHATRACSAWFVDGNPAGLLRELRRAVARYDEAGDVYNACDQRANVGFAETTLGLYSDAAATLRTALRDARVMRVERLIQACKQNLSLALCHLGELDEARALASESAESLEAHGDQRLAAGSRIYLSAIALLAEQPGEAENQARLAVALCPEASALRLTASAAHARALMAGGRPREAQTLMSEVMDTVGRLSDVGDGEMTIRLAWAESLHANGQYDAARQAIASAHQRLLEQARQIDDATWRESFLHQVADHARLHELFRDWKSP